MDHLAGRCWIFGSAAPLDGEGGLAGSLSSFMTRWQSHGAAVTGGWRVLHGHFLVVLQSPEGADPSGCSIDSMKGEIQGLEKMLGVSLLDSGRIFFRDGAGNVQAVTRAQFKSLAASGAVGYDTEVFDTTITDPAVLGSFSRPLRDSWHLQLVRSVLAPA
jgi:hypothetical protein